MLPVMGNSVVVRGISFPADQIRAAMLETGGQVVAQEELNSALDIAMKKAGGSVEMLSLSHLPGIYFVPKKVKLHCGIPGKPGFDVSGKPSSIYLYFAVRKLYGGTSLSS